MLVNNNHYLLQAIRLIISIVLYFVNVFVLSLVILFFLPAAVV